ncbi:hypothetical protein D3C86_1751810 [compost metagenome]
MQGVGKQIGQRYDNGRDAEGYLEAVAQQPVKVGTGHQFPRRQPATALPGFGAETAPENGQQRHQYSDAEQHQQQDFAANHKQPITDLGTRDWPHLLAR